MCWKPTRSQILQVSSNSISICGGGEVATAEAVTVSSSPPREHMLSPSPSGEQKPAGILQGQRVDASPCLPLPFVLAISTSPLKKFGDKGHHLLNESGDICVCVANPCSSPPPTGRPAPCGFFASSDFIVPLEHWEKMRLRCENLILLVQQTVIQEIFQSHWEERFLSL